MKDADTLELPKPLTMYESIALLKFYLWNLWYDVTGTDRADYMRTLKLYEAYNERKYVVGEAQAQKDYYED